jgi:hypothetical protein
VVAQANALIAYVNWRAAHSASKSPADLWLATRREIKATGNCSTLSSKNKIMTVQASIWRAEIQGRITEPKMATLASQDIAEHRIAVTSRWLR